MPDPANLPLELFNKVLNHIATDTPSVIATDYEINDPDPKEFHACCLVSRRWYANTTPRLYSRWIYDGTENGVTRLWNFLRTILSRPDVATFVRFAGIKGLDSNLAYHDNLPAQDQESVRNAMRMAGMAEIGNSRIRAQDLSDLRLLMALVLTCLPKLKTLEASMYENDQYFAQVLRLALPNNTSEQPTRRAFQHLSKFNLSMRETSRPHEPDLRVEGMWPAFRLPSIRELSFFDVPDRLTISDCEKDARTSQVTHLAIVEWDSSYLRLAVTKCLLTLPTRLVHLSLYMYDYDHPSDGIDYLSNIVFSGLLAEHQNSLEYLDFYRQKPPSFPKFHIFTHTHMDLLRSFRSMKSLMIHPEDLLGGCCGSSRASFRLRDTLPPNLRSLTFYASGDPTGLPDIEDEIIEAVCDKDFATLKTLVLEKIDVKSRGSSNVVNASWPTLRGACKERAIEFRTADRCTLPIGGSNIQALQYF